MNQIVLDEAVAEQLRMVVGPATMLDAAGRTLGYFTRAFDPADYEGLEPPFSEEELREADKETDGRALAEILAELEGRK